MRSCNLVATEDAIRSFFPGQPWARTEGKPGLPSAQFPVEPRRCSSKFGQWLAQEITSTRFDDVQSRLIVVLPRTRFDAKVRELADVLQQTSVSTPGQAESLFEKLRLWAAEQRTAALTVGAGMFEPYEADFQWPVFRSAMVKDARTPEEYFDHCASKIRSMRTSRVFVWHSRVEPPQSIGICK